jgi:hypothetical protein
VNQRSDTKSRLSSANKKVEGLLLDPKRHPLSPHKVRPVLAAQCNATSVDLYGVRQSSNSEEISRSNLDAESREYL